MRAGNSFKCLLCKNSYVFRHAMVNSGISIVDRIAYWELDPEALQEQWYRHNLPVRRLEQSRNLYYADTVDPRALMLNVVT
jgi:hypothetical protein